MTKNSTSILDVARYTLCSLFAICFFQMLQLFGRQVGFQISFFVYQYAIVLLLGYSIISSYYNSQTYNRFETRKRIVTNQLFLYALLNLILVTMLFVLAMAVTMILGGAKKFSLHFKRYWIYTSDFYLAHTY